MKFKVGDKIVMTESCEYAVVYKGEKRIVQKDEVGDHYVQGRDCKCFDSELWKLVTSSNKSMENPKGAKWGVCWKKDVDPTQFFKTKAQADKKVGELIDEGIDERNIFLFEIKDVFQVEKPKIEFTYKKV